MKATLYAIRIHSQWTWRATLDMEVDLDFWFKHNSESLEIIQLHPFISWGQAAWLTERLNEKQRKQQIHDQRGEIIKELTSLQVHSELIQSLELREWDGQQWTEEHQTQLGHVTDFSVDDQVSSALGDLPPTHWTAALQGRSLLPNEWLDFRTFWTSGSSGAASESQMIKDLQEAYLHEQIQLKQGIQRSERQKWWRQRTELSCERCGSGPESMRWTHCVFCQGPCPYCEQCLTMGRVRFCTPLIQRAIVDDNITKPLPIRPLSYWGLNNAQTDASQAGLDFLKQTSPLSDLPPSFLIWAVTGAGKTEMIFPLIENELALGHQVMIATPRRDVVMELMPRIQAAFPLHSLLTLYGGSRQRWEQADITLATTHQLLRFQQGFDLVILDELDAFPFHNNPMLEFAAAKACKPQGRFVFLSATPTKSLQRRVKRKLLPHVKVPVRFHRHPLPVPQLIAIKPIHKWINQQPMPQALAKSAASLMSPIPAKLLQVLGKSLERGAQLFIFVSQIRWIEPLLLLLRAHFQDKVIQGTYSKDTERNEKVVHFRQTKIDILVTTTILERGITVAKTDVFVLDADAALFDEASLVQMAGRAGRSQDDPFGNVYYTAFQKTNAQVAAIRHIKRMNALAKAKGYFNK
ncbi:MAG: helicase [Bacilli bacterium]|nr:helicase [Bacilli bacterium]